MCEPPEYSNYERRELGLDVLRKASRRRKHKLLTLIIEMCFLILLQLTALTETVLWKKNEPVAHEPGSEWNLLLIWGAFGLRRSQIATLPSSYLSTTRRNGYKWLTDENILATSTALTHNLSTPLLMWNEGKPTSRPFPSFFRLLPHAGHVLYPHVERGTRGANARI